MSFEFLSDKERITRLETQREEDRKVLEAIDKKLDELIELKAKGMGALTLASVIVTSGILGIIFTVWQMLKGQHL